MCATVFFLFLTNIQCYVIERLTDLDYSGCMGKYPTSVLLYSSSYCSVNTARSRFDIFHKALTLSKLLILTIFAGQNAGMLFSIVFRHVIAINTIQYYILAACYLLYFYVAATLDVNITAFTFILKYRNTCIPSMPQTFS